MMKYVVCGTSVEDVEAGVKAMKMAIASGATYGVGGNTMEEVEKNLDAMKQMVGGVAPTTPEACSCSCSRSVSGREVRKMIEEAKPKIGYRWAIATPNGWHEPHEKTFATIDEVKADVATFGYPMEYVSIDKVSDDDGAISVIQCVKHASSVCTEDEYGDVAPSQMGRDCLRSPDDYCPYCEDEDEEDIGYCEGYMAMTERGREISDLCDAPEQAMVDAINEGYDLDEIYINEVRVYDDDAVEVTDTVHRPTN